MRNVRNVYKKWDGVMAYEDTVTVRCEHRFDVGFKLADSKVESQTVDGNC